MKAATIQAEGCANRESLFQSTPPVKAATGMLYLRYILNCISIHAAREGGDAFADAFGEPVHVFQSTPPVKAATSTKDSTAKMIGISIHAAREGGDGCPMAGGKKMKFQSTPPVKAATVRIVF